MTFRKWLRVVLIAGVLLLGASFGFSRALRASAARRYLLAHLTASFGRPVEVSWFDFNLFDGARIEAHLVSVAEDPHFGDEYFLRADALTAGLRWRALFAGRFEFGSVSLLRPSLNLVRDAEGHWNIESWLPPAAPPGSRPGFVGPLPPSRNLRAARLGRIDVSDGRINFKRQDTKIPFALTGVSGRVEQDGTGRWQLDLEALPMRAGVGLQDIGTIRLRGRVAGTTARLQPAEFHLTWRAASIADALRLARQNDYGMRGDLAVDLDARVAPPQASAASEAGSGGAQWFISGVARMTQIHGWKLPERSTDPAANLTMEIAWRLGEPRVEVRKLLVEMPASRLQATGDLEWSHGFQPQLHIKSSTLALADLLSWYRALRPNVFEDLGVQGALDMDLAVSGWPPALQQGIITSAGASVTSKSLPAPLRIGALQAGVIRGGLDFVSTEVSFAPSTSGITNVGNAAARPPQQSFILQGSVLPGVGGVFHWPPNWYVSIEGSTPRVQDWLALSEALAQGVYTGWNAAGGIAVKLRGVHRPESPATAWLGTMDFLGLSLSPAYINHPVRLTRGHVDFASSQETVTLTAGEAFGAVWHGSIARKNSDPFWTFDLSADRLNTADLDRWLGPRARPGFLARFAGLQSPVPASPLSDPLVTRIAARGRLRAGEVRILPIQLENFDGQAELAGRAIRIRKSQADFFGGKVSGSFDALLQPDPSYEFSGQFERVNLSQLGRAVTFLNNRMKGNVSGSLDLSAHGIGRPGLVGSMRGQGLLDGRNIELRDVDLSSLLPGNIPDSKPNVFPSVVGAYRVRAGGIDLSNLVLDDSKGEVELEGRIEFSHALNIRIRPSILQAGPVPAAVSPQGFLLSGTIENPKIIPSPTAAGQLPGEAAVKEHSVRAMP